MKRIIWAIAIVVMLVLAVNVYTYAVVAVSTNYPKDYKVTEPDARVWAFAAPGYKNATTPCTLATVDAFGFEHWAMWIRRSCEATASCDSAHATIYRDASFDGSSWVCIDTTDLAGKTADTLGTIVFFQDKYWEFKDSTQIAAGYNLIKRAREIDRTSALYYRFRIVPNNAANCSTYFHAPKVFAKP